MTMHEDIQEIKGDIKDIKEARIQQLETTLTSVLARLEALENK